MLSRASRAAGDVTPVSTTWRLLANTDLLPEETLRAFNVMLWVCDLCTPRQSSDLVSILLPMRSETSNVNLTFLIFSEEMSYRRKRGHDDDEDGGGGYKKRRRNEHMEIEDRLESLIL